mgnify:CR=1 FL=1
MVSVKEYNVRVGNGATLPVVREGKSKVNHHLTLKHVAHCPGLQVNLMSVGALIAEDLNVQFRSVNNGKTEAARAFICDNKGKTLASATMQNNLYIVDAKTHDSTGD